MEEMRSLLQFYGWWEFVTCLFAFLGLLAIWYHLGKKKGDTGQIWLALSILCWSLSGLFEIYYANDMPSDVAHKNLQGWRSIFSLLNSLFILCALPWFRHRPSWLGQILENRSWYAIVGLPFLFSLLPTLSRMWTGSDLFHLAELDVYYAIFTLILLVIILWYSFSKRGLYLLGYLSVLFIGVTLVAQFYKFSDDIETLLITSAIFKSLLIMIFFALALSWVKDLAGQLQLSDQKLSLRLEKQKKENGKYDCLAFLSGVENKTHSIPLTLTQYELWEKFIDKKKSDPENGWLEIKPKNDTRNITYPIKDYNEIKRALHYLLDGIYGKGNWDKDRHESPLKESLFEFSKEKGRHIRLKIPVSEN